MLEIRRADDRGRADHGWLKTFHSFSFGQYYDERFPGFRSLRVINDDRIAPGRGFGTHPHRDMEIITYVLKGTIEHKDSMGNGSAIRAGEIQGMSAGSGITHSEFNGSADEELHLLQIWITPNEPGIKPTYAQIKITDADKEGQLCLIGSHDGRNGSLMIHQDVSVYATILKKGQSLTIPIPKGRHLWLQVALGTAEVNDESVFAGDGVAISDEAEIKLTGVDRGELLIFDLA